MLAWDDLRFLLAVQRGGSHASAGIALGVDPTTVGRRLAALEGSLGARLFERKRAGIAPTEAGARLVARAERIEGEVLAAERDLAGADARIEGTVRLTTGDGLAAYVLVPALLAFRRANPGVDLEVYGDNRARDLTRREADVAVRLFRPREPSLVARRLGTLEYGIFAGQEYLAERGAPRGERDLAGHAWLGYDDSLRAMPQEAWMRRRMPGARRVLRLSTTTALVAACAVGHGLALLPLAFAATDARLVRALPRLAVPSREIWSVIHQDLRKSARVRAVMAWLTSTLGDASR